MRAVVQERYGPPEVLELREVEEPRAGDSTRAELVAVPEKTLAGKPARLSFEQAAAVPVAALTARRGSATRAASSRASGCWSTGPRAGSAPSPSSSPRPLAPR
jgi:NADPH:quinone reductase-like Zn-dependent oxidoreductase